MRLQEKSVTLYAVIICTLFLCMPFVLADKMDQYTIARHGKGNITYPKWFKQSFLNLKEDLDDARTEKKLGIIVFISHNKCSHCRAFIDVTLNDLPTQKRIRKHYAILQLEVFSDNRLTDVNGKTTTVRDYAEKEAARLAPTLIFYTGDKARKTKIVGFYPPKKMNMVLDYIENRVYTRETLSQYFKRKRRAGASASGKVGFRYDLFARPPHSLDRHRKKASRPLMVFFDRPGCDACKRFHERVLTKKAVRYWMKKYSRVQLDATDRKTMVTTPSGKRVSPATWYNKLRLNYDMAVVFFDVNGREVHRIDSELGSDRMTNTLQYVLTKGYVKHKQYLRWIRENLQTLRKNREMIEKL